MSNFNYQEELLKLIKSKQLVEVNIREDGEHLAGYLFYLNDEYFVYGEISNDATFLGTTIRLSRDLESIQTKTRFLDELSKIADAEVLHEEAWRIIENVKSMSFEGFVSAFKESESLIFLTTVDGETFTGKVFAYDDEILVLDEYYLEENTQFSRTYINPSLISAITVGGSWLKTLSRSLSQK